MNPGSPILQVRPTISLNSGGTTSLGSGEKCDRRLLHPLIAARHVEFILGSGKPTLHDFGSGTFVNGYKILGKHVPIQPGDQIDVGPYLFTFTGVQLEPITSMDYVQLMARDLHRVVRDGKKQKVLFDRISLVFNPGEFTCLLGPSGCGKSSLLAALSGRVPPSSGTVSVNQRDLYSRFEALKRHIVLVPQKPLVHSGLGVEQALRFTARLRLPFSTDSSKLINDLIAAMELEERRRQSIAILSGGQEKRFCLANEFISDPGLIFLDEVTSGLDEHIDAKLMRQFQDLAEQKRKNIICVTHSLSNVPQHCHQVVFLTPGGRLAFAGTPAGALDYFKVDRLGDVYPLLTPENAEALADHFTESEEGKTYVAERFPETERPESYRPPTVSTNPVPQRQKIRLTSEAGTVAYQTAVLSIRQLILLAKDRWTLLSLLGQVLLVACILGLSFGRIGTFPEMSEEDKKDFKTWERVGSPFKDKVVHEVVIRQMNWVRTVLNLTFLVGVTSFWFGCNNAAREIVRERAIVRQEQFFNLRPLAYFLSKLMILTVIGWLQVAILLFGVWFACKPPEAAIGYLPTVLALAFAGTCLGLFISAVASSESVAVTLIPIAVIPQIILSGAIVKLTGIAAYLASIFVTTYWGKQSMDSLLTGKPMEFAQESKIALITLPTEYLSMTVILLHSVVFSVMTLAALHSDGSAMGILGKTREWFLRTFRLGGSPMEKR